MRVDVKIFHLFYGISHLPFWRDLLRNVFRNGGRLFNLVLCHQHGKDSGIGGSDGKNSRYVCDIVRILRMFGMFHKNRICVITRWRK